MAFMDRFLTEATVKGKNILEVGSYDVNGSVRPLAMRHNPRSYIGTDMREGPGVDEVVDACKLDVRFGAERFDVVICAEMLEHAEDWRSVVENMKSVLKEGGLLLLTTRSKGYPLHDFPSDHWRFEVDDMKRIFADMDVLTLESDPQDPGVFVAAVDPEMYSSIVDLSEITVYSMAEKKTSKSH